jgi:hypothetical protein
MKTESRFPLPSLVLAFVLALNTSASASEEAPRVKTIRPNIEGQIIKAQVDSKGTIHLLLQGADGPQYAKSQDDGKTFSAPVSIVDGAARKPGLEFQGEDMAIGKDGRVFVAMSNNAWKLKLPENEWGLYFATLLPGAKEFTPTRNLNLKPSEGFSLAADVRGSVTACFLSDKLYAKVSQDNGKTFSSNAEPNPEWNPCNCCTTSATYGPDGKLAVLYREETHNERDMYVVLWDESGGGKPTRTRVSRTGWKLEACPMTYFNITPTADGYVAAWPTKGQIYFARLDKDGSLLPPGEIKTPGTNGMRTGVLALSAKDGSTLVAWKKNDILGWQLYDRAGKPVGENGSAPSSGNGAAGVALENGSFLLFL